MPGIPVVITDKYGIPVRQVTSGAPLMTVATNGRGIPIVLSNRGMAFVVEGLAPAPSWSVQPSISGTPQVGQTLTGSDGTIANGTVTLRQWLNAADNSVLGTGSTLLLTEAMEGLNIKFKVTAVGVGGSASATSTQVGPVAEAPANVVITNVGYVFTNANGDAGQWYRDNVAISGQTGSSYTGSAVNDEGRWIGQKIGGVLSNVIVIEAETPETLINFNQANGTLLSAYPTTPFTMWGGDAPEQAKWTCQSNAAHANRGTSLAMRNTGSTEHFAEYEVTDATALNSLLIYASDTNNFLRWEPQGSPDMWWLYARVGGSWSSLTDNGVKVIGSMAAGKKSSVTIKNGQFQMIIDGLPYAKSVGFGNVAVQQDIWYDLPSGMAPGTYVGLRPHEGVVSTSDNLRYGSLSKPITIYSVEVFQDGLDQKLRIEGTADAGVLNDAVILVTNEATGALVMDWSAATGAPGAPGGDFTIESDALPTDAGGIEANVYLSDDTDRELTTSELVDIPVSMPGFRKGINNSNSGMNFRNLFSLMEVYFPDEGYKRLRQAGEPAVGDVSATQVGMGYDGVIQSYVSGFAANISYGRNDVFIEQGDWEINYDPALSCTLTNYEGGALSGVTILTPFSGGYGKIRTSVDIPSLRFTFTGGTNGSLNLKPTGYLASDTNRTRLYAESSIVPFATSDAKVERHLDSLYGNGPQSGDNVVRLTAAQIWVGGSGVAGPFSPEMIAQKANAQGTDVWIPCSHLWQGEEYLEAFFTRLVAALNPWLKIYIEGPNEVWNPSFSAFNWVKKEGVLAGFYPIGITNSADAVPLVAQYAVPGVDYDPDTGYMLRTYTNGTVVLFENLNGAGMFWAQAQKNIVTGAADKIEKSGSTPISNAAWTVLGDNNDAARAGMRWYANWADFVWSTLDAVCVAAGQDPRVKTVRVLAWQAGNYPTDILDWNNIHERFDAWAEAPYWSNDILHYDNSPMTLTEKNLLGTDMPAFITVFNGYATQAVADRVADFPTRRAAAQAVFMSYGYAENEKRLISYEMGWHIDTRPGTTDGTTGHWHPNMSIVYPQLRRQSIFQTWTTDYYTGWKNIYHDVACQFNSVGELPNSYNGKDGYWPLMENNNDTTNPGILGFAAVPSEV